MTLGIQVCVCTECAEQFETIQQIESHIHEKHGHHICHSCRKKDCKFLIEGTCGQTPCVDEHKRSVTALWVVGHTDDKSCVKCFHEDGLDGNCTCHHCRAMGTSHKFTNKM